MAEVREHQQGFLYLMACLAALLCLIGLMQAPADLFRDALLNRTLLLHLLMELVAVLIALMIALVSWHTFNADDEGRGRLLLGGFLVVACCDLLHALTYRGMPDFVHEANTPLAVYFWLAGRTAEALTLALIAIDWRPRAPRGASLVVGIGLSALSSWIGLFHLNWVPTTFVEGVGVTPFKARWEYLLSALNLLVAAALAWRAMRSPPAGRTGLRLLAMSSFMMGLGELAFTAYVAPSDFQNLFGHAFKLVAYALLYRATFLVSLRAPFEALKDSEAQLRESELRLRTLGDNLPQSAVYQIVRELDGTERFVHVSNALERLNGLKPADLLRDPALLYGQVVDEDRAGFLEADRLSTERMALFDKTVRMRHRDGRIRWMHLVSMPRLLPDGRILWDGIETDVTEREEAAAARLTLEAQLREAQKIESIGTLASGIAHDFNNVLGAILGNAALAEQDLQQGARDEVRHSLGQIRRAGLRARDLVRQILTFSRREAPRRQVLPLRPVVEEALSMLRVTLPAQVALITEFDDKALCAAIDITQIEQVVLNLCTNAWQAIGDRAGRIELSLQRTPVGPEAAAALRLNPGDYAQLRVLDNGIGMTEEIRQRVFDPFFTTKPVGTGTGLGLSVVHGIVRAHDGAIGVSSVPGQGSRFDVYLPLAESGDEPALVAPAAPSTRPGHGERVIYLDDDEVMAMMVERLLERAGYRVTTFLEPQAALQAVQADPHGVDLAVTDYNMPGLTGLDVVQRLQQIRPNLPLLMSSGSVSDELRRRASALGVIQVIEKQHMLEELVAAVGEALSARDGAAEVRH